MLEWPIESYEVLYFSNKDIPTILLNLGDNTSGALSFMPNGSALPTDSMVGSNVHLYYQLKQWQNVIDLLRREEVTLVYNGQGYGAENGITTNARKTDQG